MGDWWKSVDRWLAIAGVVCGIAGILLVKEARETFNEGITTYGPKVVQLLAVGMVVAALWRTRALRRLRSDFKQLSKDKEEMEGQLAVTAEAREKALAEVASLKLQSHDSIPYRKHPRGRWDTLDEVRFGHLEYPPFLTYGTGKEPVGLGVDLLKQLLAFPVRGKPIHLQADDIPRDWEDILKGLVNEKYDVVATPLFATFDRSKEVGFTAPLFFSNVGLYVRKDFSSMPFWKDLMIEDLNISDPEAVARREQALRLRFISVKGEISEKLSSKYADEAMIERYPGKTILSNLFEKIASSNPNNPPYGLFCESFYAHFQTRVKSGEVVNLMPWHKIIYPVCFATRIGDYQLRNLLNIRLLELAEKGGALSVLSKKLEENKEDGLSAEDVKRHFIAQWPYPAEAKSSAHA